MMKATYLATYVPHSLTHILRFAAFQSTAFTGLTGSIVVPSRLYFKKTAELPLNGVRISIKDNMHLNGVETTLEAGPTRSYTANKTPPPRLSKHSSETEL